MRRLEACVAVFVLLAGCTTGGTSSSASAGAYTCPAGFKVDLSGVPGHDQPGFNATAYCQPPSIKLVSLPANVEAYHSGMVSWQPMAGNTTGAHSMISEVVMGHHAAPDGEIADLGPDLANYPGQILILGSMEHQNLPAGPFVSSFRYEYPGTFYVRAVARIYATGLPEKTYFSPTVVLNITAVAATGNTTTLTHPVGNAAGTLAPKTASPMLGDGVVFKNDDVVMHRFTFTKVPAGVMLSPVDVPMQTSSTPVVLTVPGHYEVTTDDIEIPQTASLEVALPA
jgi:hypothetical protein